jgi:hypothetical protein
MRGASELAMTSLRTQLVVLAAAGGLLAHVLPARACGGRAPTPAAAFPGPGATEVSPQSSIFVSTPSGFPAALTVEANGQAVPLPAGQPLGSGPVGSWLRLPGPLSAGASYVVRVHEEGVANELTHFTTAAAYDKAPGTPAKLTGLRLWRVHYPGKIAGGDCVFSEYEGYIDLAYEPGALPGTPPDEVINVLSLSPRTGGAQQTFVFTGSQRLHLAQTYNTTGNVLVDVPPGGLPSPVFAAWKPELAPDREYCATLTLYGRNDLAALPAISETVCAPVMNLPAAASGDAAKVAPPIMDAGMDAGADAGAPASSSSCAMGHGAPSRSPGLLLLALLVSVLRRRARQ